MPRRRRRRAPHPMRAAFEPPLAHVEAAKAELMRAMPSPRGVPGRSLAEALLAFEHGLRDARDAMPPWRQPATELMWARCTRGLDQALDRAEWLRLDAPELDYESLSAVLAELIGPLEVFEEAERALRFDTR